jgi:hypothetical protein
MIINLGFFSVKVIIHTALRRTATAEAAVGVKKFIFLMRHRAGRCAASRDSPASSDYDSNFWLGNHLKREIHLNNTKTYSAYSNKRATLHLP